MFLRFCRPDYRIVDCESKTAIPLKNQQGTAGNGGDDSAPVDVKRIHAEDFGRGPVPACVRAREGDFE